MGRRHRRRHRRRSRSLIDFKTIIIIILILIIAGIYYGVELPELPKIKTTLGDPIVQKCKSNVIDVIKKGQQTSIHKYSYKILETKEFPDMDTANAYRKEYTTWGYLQDPICPQHYDSTRTIMIIYEYDYGEGIRGLFGETIKKETKARICDDQGEMVKRKTWHKACE